MSFSDVEIASPECAEWKFAVGCDSDVGKWRHFDVIWTACCAVGLMSKLRVLSEKRFRFYGRSQEESVVMFVAALRKLWFEFGNVLNDSLRDRLVCGLRSSQRWQMEDSDSSKEELFANINTVKVMSVDERSDGFWIDAELEGHTIKMQIDTGSKGNHCFFQNLQEMPGAPSVTTFRHSFQSWCWTMKGMTDVLVRCNGQSKTLHQG